MGGDSISLLFPDENTKKVYFLVLKNDVRIPVCKNCNKFFTLGFPSSEEGFLDYMICSENNLLCDCVHNDLVGRLFKQKGDGLVDISPWYHIITNR